MKVQDLEALKIERRVLAEGWKRIRRIMADEFLEPSDKLTQCLAIGDIHRATYGTDDLLPPRLVAARQSVCESIPNILKRASVAKKDRESGQGALF